MWFPKTAFALSLFASLFVSANPMDNNPSQRSSHTKREPPPINQILKLNGVTCEKRFYDSNKLNRIALDACEKLRDGQFYIRHRLLNIPVPLRKRPPKTAISLELYTGIDFKARFSNEIFYLTKISEKEETKGFIHRVVVGWNEYHRTCETKGAVERHSWKFSRCHELEMEEWEKKLKMEMEEDSKYLQPFY